MSQQQRQNHKTYVDYVKSVKADAELNKARYEAMYYALKANEIKEDYFNLVEEQERVRLETNNQLAQAKEELKKEGVTLEEVV